MAMDIEDAFIRQYEAEVHQAYQRQGSKLRNTVRVKNGVKGKSTTFQKVGTGEAQQKTRHGVVPAMNVAHDPVEVTLSDWYAADWVDSLDEAKINIDERQVIANAGASALGRKTDAMIIDDALADATNNTPATVQADGTTGSSTGMNLGKVRHAMQMLGERDVPIEDGNSFAIVGWQQWSELLTIEEFASADYVGQGQLPFKGVTTAKNWMGAIWMPHSGLPLSGSDIRSCFWYHRTAVGHAIGRDVSTDITWHGDHAAWFINNMMSMGSGLIDDNGVQEILCDESP